MNQELKDKLESIIGFKESLYGLMSVIGIQMDMDEKKFKEFVEAISIDSTWDEYYEVFIKNFSEEETVRLVSIIDKVIEVEDKCMPMIESKVEAFINTLVPEGAKH